MPKYHLSEDGKPRVCLAQPGNCPRGGVADHGYFETTTEAQQWAEAALAEKYGITTHRSEPKQVQPSFDQALSEESLEVARDMYYLMEERIRELEKSWDSGEREETSLELDILGRDQETALQVWTARRRQELSDLSYREASEKLTEVKAKIKDRLQRKDTHNIVADYVEEGALEQVRSSKHPYR